MAAAAAEAEVAEAEGDADAGTAGSAGAMDSANESTTCSHTGSARNTRMLAASSLGMDADDADDVDEEDDDDDSDACCDAHHARKARRASNDHTLGDRIEAKASAAAGDRFNNDDEDDDEADAALRADSISASSDGSALVRRTKSNMRACVKPNAGSMARNPKRTSESTTGGGSASHANRKFPVSSVHSETGSIALLSVDTGAVAAEAGKTGMIGCVVNRARFCARDT